MGSGSVKRVYRGRSKLWTGIVSVAGVGRDLSNDQIYFTVKSNYSQTDGQALFQHTITSGITITDTTNGVFTYGVLPGDTDACPAARTVYRYDLTIIYQSGDRYTLDEGTLEVNPDVTSATS